MDRKLFFILLSSIILTLLFSSLVLILQEKSNVLEGWNRWDTPHYLDIAENGYQKEGESSLFIVFFPLYPFAIKLFSFLVGNYILSGLVASNLFYAIAALFLYKLAMLDNRRKNKKSPLKTVLYFSIFPTAYFLHAVYTESLFLALTIGSFYYARKQKWAFSGIFGMLAAATRIVGLVLLPALIIEYMIQKKFRLKSVDRKIAWLGIIPAGFFSYLIVNYITFGDPFHFLAVLKTHWYKTFAFPWAGFLEALNSIWWRPLNEWLMIGAAEIVFALIGLAASVYSIFRQRLSYGIYMLTMWLFITSTSFWMSIPRYTLAFFPIFILIGSKHNKKIDSILVFGMILSYAVFLGVFIIGQWAF